jgi:type IV secretion system protein VirD4
MGIATLIEKILHLLIWGFDRRLHKARFARLDELSGITHRTPDPTSLLIGVNRFKHFLLVRPQPERRELGNMLIVAPTRAGKGLLATSQLFTWQHSVVVNDLKGDLFTATAGYRSTLGQVYVFDPTGVGHRYDPLLSRTTEDQLYAASARLLFKPQERDPIFTQRATTMLTQLFLAARLEAVPPLPYTRGITRLGLAGAAKRLHELSPLLATEFLDVHFAEANFTDRFLLSAWGTLTASVKPLLTETVIRCFHGSDFTPADLLQTDKPITVYLRWPERDLLALSPLVRLVWGSIIDELITTYDKAEGRDCKPVLLLIDEAGRTAIPSLADHATTVVGRGITLWVAVQSLEQLRAEYGEARAQVIMDNMETQLYYRPSGQKTADYLEHCLGRKSGYARSQTLKDGDETTQGRAEQGVPLLTATEIKQMKDREIIGFHRRLPPFRMRRVDWRHDQDFLQKRQLPAPRLPMLPPLEEYPLTAQQVLDNGYVDPDMLLATGTNRRPSADF